MSESESFQDFLPCTTPRYKYKGYEECLRLVEEKSEELEKVEDGFQDQLGGAYNPFFIMDIDERSFLDCFVESGEKLLTLSWEIYDFVHQSTLLKMESSQHAVARGAFDTIFSAWARGVTHPSISNTGTRGVRGENRCKKADISWTPTDPPLGRSQKWPTFVGEVAWSEGRPKLTADMQFWLQEATSDVKAAITITILHHRIKIESWEVRNQSVQPTQEIQISRNLSSGSPTVTGSLQIRFSDVFLRNPRGGEGNFALTIQDMLEIARHVWSFKPRCQDTTS